MPESMSKWDPDKWKREWAEETERAAMDLIIGLIMYKESIRFVWWKWFHNFVVHPLMAWPWPEPEWLNRLHDWTALQCWGAG